MLYINCVRTYACVVLVKRNLSLTNICVRTCAHEQLHTNLFHANFCSYEHFSDKYLKRILFTVIRFRSLIWSRDPCSIYHEDLDSSDLSDQDHDLCDLGSEVGYNR